MNRSTDCLEAKGWGSCRYVLGSWMLTLQSRDQARVFPDICPGLLPAETQGHGVGNAPKCSYSIVRACTYVGEFSSRPSCIDAGSWSSTDCSQFWGAGVRDSQTILTKWHPEHKCAVFTIFHTLFQSRCCKILQHSTATGVLSPASIWTGGIIHSLLIFMLKNSSVKGQYWKFLQISLFEILKFSITQYLHVKLNEHRWGWGCCMWNIICWWKKKATHEGKTLPGTQAVDRQTNESWAKKYKSPLQ